jgi:VanZ family protein
VKSRGILVYWLPPALYLLLIYILSGMSRPPVPEGIDQNLLHFPEYALLGLLLARALQGEGRGRVSWVLIAGAVALSALFGFLDELHQAFVPERVPDVADWVHDVMGALIGALAWGGYRWIRR